MFDWSYESLGFPIPEVVVWLAMTLYSSWLFKDVGRSKADRVTAALMGDIYCLIIVGVSCLLYVIEPARIVIELIGCLAGLHMARASQKG